MINPALRQEIENTFEVVRDRCTRDEIVIICPQPGCSDKSGHRGINIKTGATSCFLCGVAGHVIPWAKRIGIEFRATDDTGGISLSDMVDWQPSRAKAMLPLVQPVKMPAGFTRIADDPSSVYTRCISRLARRKHLDHVDFAQVDAGFTRDDPRWEPYAIFPVIEDGVRVYFQGRLYSEEPGESTKRFPGRWEVKFGARYWVYNIDELRKKQAPIVLVVEAILNVLSLRRKLAELGRADVVAVSVFKHGISTEQVLKLNRCGFLKEICLLFDHDATDASWKTSWKIANRLKVTIAEMPAGPDNTRLDPNDDVDAAWDAFLNRKVYTPLSANEHLARSRFARRALASLAGKRF